MKKSPRQFVDNLPFQMALVVVLLMVSSLNASAKPKDPACEVDLFNTQPSDKIPGSLIFERIRRSLFFDNDPRPILRMLLQHVVEGTALSQSDQNKLNTFARRFNPDRVSHETEIAETAEILNQLIGKAPDLEVLFEQLSRTGLKLKLSKIGSIHGNTPAHFMQKKPLPSFPVGSGSGRTARELGLTIVTHATRRKFAFDSLTRPVDGRPNALISQRSDSSNMATYGEGFYVTNGEDQSTAHGPKEFHIHFALDPEARESTDFVYFKGFSIILNRNALRMMNDSLLD